MNKIALSLAVLAPFAAQAETVSIEIEKPEFYGKINVSQEFVQQENDSGYSQLNSNASRLGVKGSIALDHGLTGIYQAEFEMFPDDGEKSTNQTFSQRNTFIGIKGGFGAVQAGMFDTPMKMSQNKVDLFNDLQGDIKNIISASENRSKNSVQYTSPAMAGLVLAVDHINAEDKTDNDGVRDNGLSASLAYTRGDIYVAYAYDNAVNADEVEVSRVVGQYRLGAVQLGALWENQSDNGDHDEGWMTSVAYKATSDVTLKAQYGESDIKAKGGVSYSLGADYKLAKNAKTFVYATNEDCDDDSVNAQYYGAGLEYKF